MGGMPGTMGGGVGMAMGGIPGTMGHGVDAVNPLIGEPASFSSISSPESLCWPS